MLPKYRPDRNKKYNIYNYYMEHKLWKKDLPDYWDSRLRKVGDYIDFQELEINCRMRYMDIRKAMVFYIYFWNTESTRWIQHELFTHTITLVYIGKNIPDRYLIGGFFPIAVPVIRWRVYNSGASGE